MQKIFKSFIAGLLLLSTTACQSPAQAGESMTDQQVAQTESPQADPTDQPASEPEGDPVVLGEFSDMTGYGLPEDQTTFVNSRFSEIMEMVDEKKSFVMYLGHDTCDWCQRAVPVLYQAAQELEAPVYYINTDNAFAWTSEDQTESFNRFLELVKEDMSTDESGEKALYLPFVVFFRNGAVIDAHTGTLDYDNLDTEFTDEMKGELKQIYYTGFIRAGV